MTYTFEFDALGIVQAANEDEAREIWGAMIALADSGGGSLAPLDNYTVYDAAGNEVDPDDLEVK